MTDWKSGLKGYKHALTTQEIADRISAKEDNESEEATEQRLTERYGSTQANEMIEEKRQEDIQVLEAQIQEEQIQRVNVEEKLREQGINV